MKRLFVIIVFLSLLLIHPVHADPVSDVKSFARALSSANSPGRTTGKFTWDSEGKGRSWTYYNGIMMDAFFMLDSSYFSYVDAFYNANISTQTANKGSAYGYVNDRGGSTDNYYRYTELDSIPPTRALFDLIRGGSGQSAKYKQMIQYVYNVMKTYTVVGGTNGNFIHKSSWTTYQIGLDGLYMAQPFFMELAKAIEDGFISPSGYDSPDNLYKAVCDRLIWVGTNMFAGGLYHHGWGPSVEGNGHYWLRGIGWYAAALTDVISMLPQDRFASEREQLISILNDRMFAGMLPYQDESGLWRNVVDKSREAVYNSTTKNYNELETSGSALMAYAMMKAFNEGFAEEEYGRAGLKAFKGIVNGYLDGQGLHNVYKQSGVEGTDEGYLRYPFVTNEAKGVGPLFMAASEAEKIVIPPRASDLVYGQMLSESDLVGGEAGLEGTFSWAETDLIPDVPGGDYDVLFVPTAGSPTRISVMVKVEKAEAGFTPPVAAENLVYTGEAQELIIPGDTEDGVFQYRISEELPTTLEIAIVAEDILIGSGEEDYSEGLPSAIDAGTYTVFYRVAGDMNHLDSEEGSISVVMEKAEPMYTIPSDLTAAYGQSLSDVLLPEGWEWEEKAEAEVGPVGEKLFSATFTPEDTKNYHTITMDLMVLIKKAPQEAPLPPGQVTSTATTISILDDGYEYSLDRVDWQRNTVFAGLIPGQEYTIFQRVPGDENHEPSPASEGIIFSTGEASVLPASLSEIEDEAFRGCSFEAVIIPEGITRIGERAFADCDNLRYLSIPDSVISIAENAFSGSEYVMIYCDSGNIAEESESE